MEGGKEGSREGGCQKRKRDEGENEGETDGEKVEERFGWEEVERELLIRREGGREGGIMFRESK